MTAVEELQDTTSGFGWPASLKVYRRGEHVFFEVQAVVELLGVEKQVRKTETGLVIFGSVKSPHLVATILVGSQTPSVVLALNCACVAKFMHE